MAGQVNGLHRLFAVRMALPAMRKSHSAFFGAMLCVIAMFGVIALSGWHSAFVHVHAPVGVAAIDQDHGHHAPKTVDEDSPTHALAHATSQWVAQEQAVASVASIVSPSRDWAFSNAVILGKIDPFGILRPPRG